MFFFSSVPAWWVVVVPLEWSRRLADHRQPRHSRPQWHYPALPTQILWWNDHQLGNSRCGVFLWNTLSSSSLSPEDTAYSLSLFSFFIAMIIMMRRSSSSLPPPLPSLFPPSLDPFRTSLRFCWLLCFILHWAFYVLFSSSL